MFFTTLEKATCVTALSNFYMLLPRFECLLIVKSVLGSQFLFFLNWVLGGAVG